MQSTSHWKHGLPCLLVATALLAGCSKKSSAPAESNPDASTNTSINISSPTPAANQAPAPEAPGPNADAKAYVDFGTSLGARGDLDGAVSAFDSAISLDPRYAPAYYNRGFAKALQNKSQEAVENFDKAIELNPNFRDAYYQRGTQRGQAGNFDGAVADFQQCIKIDPKFASAYYNLGHVAYFQGDEDTALKQLEQALALNPKFTFCYFIRGLVRHAQGHRAEATADFQKSLGLNFPYAAFWVFICDSESGQRGLGRKELTDSLSRPDIFRPNSFPIHIANFLLDRMTQDELIAKATATPESERTDNLCASWYYAGVVRRLNGDMAGAKTCFTKAIATGAKGSEEYVEANREISGLK